jgi:hypothetical protein
MNRQINFNLEKIGLFRKATFKDITEGNIVYLIGDGDEMHKMTIDEVLHPHDDFKAFCANDGCRYGLRDLWVLKSGNDIQKRVDVLENAITSIRAYLNGI